MASEILRKTILGGVKTYLNALYNSTNGTTGKWFRTVRRGPLIPAADMIPALTICDGGQRRAEERLNDDAGGQERVLAVSLVLQLAENWERVTPSDDWSDRVERIVDSLQSYTIGAGIVRFDYVDDDPVDVLFQGGQTEAAWLVTFEVHYFVDHAAH